MTGKLISIVYSPVAGSFNRKPLPHAVLVAGYGIERDRKGGHPTAFKLRMELTPQHPRMVAQLRDLDQTAVRRNATQHQPGFT